MEYNLKEKLLDKIGGREFIEPSKHESWYNRGVRETKAKVVTFFNDELVPEVPQDIVDWYEAHRDDLDYSIWNVINSKVLGSIEDRKVKSWINDTEDAIIILVKMHLFGYKVKKGIYYRVKMVACGQYLYTDDSGDTYFSRHNQSEYLKESINELGFGWILDFPGIELEEVE